MWWCFATKQEQQQKHSSSLPSALLCQDPSPGVAFSINARKIHPEAVRHLARKKLQGWRNLLVIFGTEGEVDRADQNVEGVRGDEVRDPVRVSVRCPLWR